MILWVIQHYTTPQLTGEKYLRMHCSEKSRGPISGKVIGSEAKYPRSVLKIKGALSVSSSALAFITSVSKFLVKCVV